MTKYRVEFECGPVTVSVTVEADSDWYAVDEAQGELEIWGVELPREFDLSVTEVS